MTRSLLIAAALILPGVAGAQAVSGQTVQSRTTLHKPVPHRPPPTVGAAPVPNEDAQAPAAVRIPETTVVPSLLQIHYPDIGDGYVYGSSPNAMDDRNAGKALGVAVTDPTE